MAISNSAEVVSARWRDDPFYTQNLVLGIDIGLSYIGLCLRLGREVLVGETVVYSAKDSLEPRRLKRHWRRNRRAEKQRIFQLRRWCTKHGLPWFPSEQWQSLMERVYPLRLKGETAINSLTPEQLVMCLRHIVQHRGYDWHRLGGLDKAFPWGDGQPLSRECIQWLDQQYITADVAASVRDSLPPDLDEDALEKFNGLLDEALERSQSQGLRPHLEEYARNPLAVRARGKNFPREVLESHAETLLRNHADLFSKHGVDTAIADYFDLLNHHRKNENEQAAHWEKKAGRCPFTQEPCAPLDDPDAKRLRLLEFLATRRFAVARKRSPLPPTLRRVPVAIIAWLLEHPENQAEPLPASGVLRREFEQRVCGPDEKLASDKSSLNGDFFTHLRDILFRRTGAARRAALSAPAAREWYQRATANGTNFEPTAVVRALKEYYDKRREAQLAQWFHPHVEFLLGPRAYLLHTKPSPQGQLHGWLNRMLARPSIVAKLREAGHTGKPDNVIIEVVGDIPRTSLGRRKIELAQKERRAHRDALIERYQLDRSNENALLRATLWEQQGGGDPAKQPALCPLTGTELPGGPGSSELELAHIYPRTWGGPFLQDNLFLTSRTINAAMDNEPPAKCVGYSPERVGAMRWPDRKKLLFTTVWPHPSQGLSPEWGLDTRVAQLARQLRDAMRVWLGIGDENEMSRRVGTVTGFFTAQCRKAWLQDYTKDRADLRNHLYDAMVLTHIPPGPGLNSAAFGGIFVTADRRDPDGNLVTSYRPPAPLGPDWQSFAQAHQHNCLVQRPRSRSPKTKRFDETIYGLERNVRTDAKGKLEKAPRLRIREVLTAGGWPVPDAEKWLLAADRRDPGFGKLLPEPVWRAWLEENARRQAAGEDQPMPLMLPGQAPIRALRVDASKPQFLDVSSLAAHGERGAKNPTERNLALDLYSYQDSKGRTKIITRAVSHPRALQFSKAWQAQGFELPDETSLPDGAQRVARVMKGDLLCLPLSKDGSIATDFDQAYSRVWCHITALKTSGQIETRPTEFLPKELKIDTDGIVIKNGSRLFGQRMKGVYKFQNESLLNLLRLNPSSVT